MREGSHDMLTEFDVVNALALGKAFWADQELSGGRPVRFHDVVLAVEDLADVVGSSHPHRGPAEQVGLEEPTVLAEFLFVKLRTLPSKREHIFCYSLCLKVNPYGKYTAA